MMKWIQRLGVGVAVIAQIIGTVFLVATLYYLILYLTESANSSRHEYMMGATFGLLYGTGAYLGATYLASVFHRSLSRRTFRWLVWPGLIVGGVFLIFHLAALSFSMFYK